MPESEEVLVAALGAAASILYFFVARSQLRRRVGSESRSALRGFVLWWGGLGVLGLTTMVLTFLPEIHEFGLTGVRLILYPLLGLVMALCAGLVHYLLFLYTGRPGTRLLAYGFYALLFLFLVWLLEAHQPHIGLIHEGEPNAGEQGFHLHDEPATWSGLVFSIGLVGPLFASAVAYGLLFFRTHDRTARYRIAFVSTGFVLWFAYSLFGTILREVSGIEEQSLAGRIVGQLLGVLAATLTLLAYHPPRRWQERYGLRSLGRPPSVRDQGLRSPETAPSTDLRKGRSSVVGPGGPTTDLMS